MNKNDLRYQKTDEAIRNAFLEYVEDASFDTVHVSDICKRAGISRRAFYSHYDDKYGLLAALFQKLKDDIRRELTPGIVEQMMAGDFLEPTRWHMAQVAKNRAIIRPILKLSRQAYIDLCIELYYDLPWSDRVADYDLKKKDPKVYLSISYLVNGMVSLVETWLEHFEEVSFDDALHLMTLLCEKPAAQFVNILMKE